MSDSVHLTWARLRSLTGLPTDHFMLDRSLGTSWLHTVGCGHLSEQARRLELHSNGANLRLCVCITRPGLRSLWGVVLDTAAVVDAASDIVRRVEADVLEWVRPNATSMDLLRSTGIIVSAAQQLRPIRRHPTQRIAHTSIDDMVGKVVAQPDTPGDLFAASALVKARFDSVVARFDRAVARWPQHRLWSELVSTYQPEPRWTLIVAQRLDVDYLLRFSFDDTPDVQLRRVTLALAHPLTRVARAGGHPDTDFVAFRMPADDYLEFADSVLWNIHMDDDTTSSEVEIAIRSVDRADGFSSPSSAKGMSALDTARAAMAAPAT